MTMPMTPSVLAVLEEAERLALAEKDSHVRLTHLECALGKYLSPPPALALALHQRRTESCTYTGVTMSREAVAQHVQQVDEIMQKAKSIQAGRRWKRKGSVCHCGRWFGWRKNYEEHVAKCPLVGVTIVRST